MTVTTASVSKASTPRFWDDPFLWIHLAGLAALPLGLGLCALGLAVGEPLLPVELELLLVTALGVAPILWMQWYRPFDIFSILVVCLRPEVLSDDQRRVLRLFKTPAARVLTVVGALLMVVLLRRLYALSPLLAELAPLPAGLRLVGLLLAGVGFLVANLFLQVPLSVVRVLAVSQSRFETTEPYPLAQVAADFTLLGLRVGQLFAAAPANPEPETVLAEAVAPPAEPEAELPTEPEDVWAEPSVPPASSPEPEPASQPPGES